MPFTEEQFFQVFAAYNAAISPLPSVAYILGFTRSVYYSGGLGSPRCFYGDTRADVVRQRCGLPLVILHQRRSRCSNLRRCVRSPSVATRCGSTCRTHLPIGAQGRCSHGRRSRTRRLRDLAPSGARVAFRSRLPGGACVRHRTLPGRDLHDRNPATGALARCAPLYSCALGDHRRQCGASAERPARFRSSRRISGGPRLRGGKLVSRRCRAPFGQRKTAPIAANSSGRG